MAEGTNKGKLIGAIIGAVATIAIAIAAVFIIKSKVGIDDSYFVTDDKKIVISITPEDNEFGALKLHQVYEYTGEDVNKIVFYYEFENESKAQSVFDGSKDELLSQTEFSNPRVTGKYIAINVENTMLGGVSVSTLRKYAEYQESQENKQKQEPVEEPVEDAAIEPATEETAE